MKRPRIAETEAVRWSLALLCLAAVWATPGPMRAADEAADEAEKEGDSTEGKETTSETAGDDARDSGAEDAATGGEDDAGDSVDSMSERELFEVGERDEDDEEGEHDRAGRRRRDDVPLRQLSKSEAEEAGFQFGPEESQVEPTAGVFAAATGGLFIHGLGHWTLERPRAARLLLAVEGIGLALAGSGLTVWALEGDSPAGSAYAGTAFPIGAGLFGTSYAVDLVGALRGSERAMPANDMLFRRVDLSAGYRYVAGDVFPTRHLIDTALEADFGRLFARGTTRVGLGFDLRQHGGAVGWRILRGGRPLSYLFVEASGAYLRFEGTGRFQRWAGDSRLGGSLDLGAFAPTLSQIAVGGSLGAGYRWTWVPAGPQRPLELAHQGFYLPWEVFTHFNVTEDLKVRLAYLRDPDRLLQRTRRLGGIGRADLVFSSSESLQFETTIRFGAGVAVGAGATVRLWQ